ncbi:MAG TPA: hypothetical protein VJU15_07195 [Gemmatimonadales bacterium]|nr:hypothetical protein [Gemmatimonadales bacterium]
MSFAPRQTLTLLVFIATCTDPDHSSEPLGSLAVAVATSGEDLDLDGYQLRVDDTIYERVTIVWRRLIEDLTPGRHDVELIGVAENCTVSGNRRQEVNVVSGNEQVLRFEVICLATGVEVFVPQTGLDPAREVTALIDGTPVPFSTWSSARITRLAAGLHSVSLSGVAPNCRLDAANFKQVEVSLGQVTRVSFPLTCISINAVVLVTANTMGMDVDLDGYLVRVNQQVSRLSANLEQRSVLTPGGDGTVEIDDVAEHCVVLGGRVRNIHTTVGSVAVRDTARVSFEISCGERWAFAMVRNGLVTLASADGATYTLGEGISPAWSTDRRSLAFECSAQLCVQRMDGFRITAPTRESEYLSSPAWMPDGRLSFVGYTCDWYCYSYVLTGIHQVSIGGAEAPAVLRIPAPVTWVQDLAWSPDGNWIAFTCDLPQRREICRMNVAGEMDVLTTSTYHFSWGPSWSPDGQHIAFATTNYGEFPELAIMGPNRLVQRVKPGLYAEGPSWTPDGRIVFAGAGPTDRGLYVINADGTGLERLTTGQDNEPAWRP